MVKLYVTFFLQMLSFLLVFFLLKISCTDRAISFGIEFCQLIHKLIILLSACSGLKAMLFSSRFINGRAFKPHELSVPVVVVINEDAAIIQTGNILPIGPVRGAETLIQVPGELSSIIVRALLNANYFNVSVRLRRCILSIIGVRPGAILFHFLATVLQRLSIGFPLRVRAVERAVLAGLHPVIEGFLFSYYGLVLHTFLVQEVKDTDIVSLATREIAELAVDGLDVITFHNGFAGHDIMYGRIQHTGNVFSGANNSNDENVLLYAHLSKDLEDP